MTLSITWVVVAPVERQEGGGFTSGLASLRYRVLSPVSHLSAMGYRNQILTVLSDEIRPEAFQNVESDVVIFSKINYPVLIPLAEHARKSGARVIFDICDDYFSDDDIKPYYLRMCEVAGVITCNTPEMAERIREQTGKVARIIDDPYEGELLPPRFAPGDDALKLLWFGHPRNLDSLAQAMPQILQASRRRALELSVLTQITPDFTQAMQAVKHTPDMRFSLQSHTWSLAEQKKALAACDAVIIPSLKTRAKTVKSANRVVESLRARPVIAHPVPSYDPFSPWIWLGEDLGQGIEWLYASRAKIPFFIQMAQDYIEKTFSPHIAAAQWERVIRGEDMH